MSEFELKMNAAELAKELGSSLIDRLGRYLKDEMDTEFLKEMALDLADLQYRAAIVVSEEDKDIIRDDIDFIHARIDTFVARQAIKIKDEARETFYEVLQTIGAIVGTFAKAALAAAL